MNSDLSTVEQTLKQIEEEYDRLADMLPDELREAHQRQKEELAERRRQRDELVKRCHPDGNHWPPHEECPACQKLLGMLEEKARQLLGDEANNQAKLEEKFWELFEAKYVKKSTQAGQEGRAEDATGGQGGRPDGDSGDVGISDREPQKSDSISSPGNTG